MLTYDLAGPEGDYPEWDGPPGRSIVICTHPRSGSSLLGEALTFAGGFGCPLEYFHGGFRPDLERRWGLAGDDAYVAALHRHRTEPSGIFSTKLFWGDVALIVGQSDPELGAALGTPDAEMLPDDFYRRAHDILADILPAPTWVALERQDLVRQSISHVRALRSDRWRGISRAGLVLNPPVRYCFEDLLRALQWARTCRQRWQAFFTANGLAPYRVQYESLLADRGEVLLALFRALGGDHAVVPELRISKQADALSDEWLRQFVEDLRTHRPGDATATMGDRDAMG